jgi:hypothetical protein
VSREEDLMAASIAEVSTEAMGLNPVILLPERDKRCLLTVVAEERLRWLVTEDGDGDRGVCVSELLLL